MCHPLHKYNFLNPLLKWPWNSPESAHQQCTQLIAQSTQHLTESLQEDIVFFYQASSVSSPEEEKTVWLAAHQEHQRQSHGMELYVVCAPTFKFQLIIKVKKKKSKNKTNPKTSNQTLKDRWGIGVNAISSFNRHSNLGNAVLEYFGIIL